MSDQCTCAADWRAIPKERRVILEEPNAIVVAEGKKVVDRNKVHVYDKECPQHGYREIDA